MSESALYPMPHERLLLEELDHRINNEFTSIISIVSRAATRSTNEDVERALWGVTELLYHYAEVHHALQLPHYESVFDVGRYLRKLCLSISRSKLDHLNIGLVVEAPSLRLEAVRCWRLGMIVSELITNAVRHAFVGRRGEIRVELLQTGKFIECSVADNGSAPVRVRPGRGLTILEALSKSLGGSFERKFSHKGSISTVTFPYDHQRTDGTREPPRPVMREPRSSPKDRAGAPDPDHAGEQQRHFASKAMP
jgi:two-component sensor histidine kinase